jgi:hypothetical protein
MSAIPDRAVHDERQLIRCDRTTLFPPGFEWLEQIPIVFDLNDAADQRVISIALDPRRCHEIERQKWKVCSERHRTLPVVVTGKKPDPLGRGAMPH